MTPESGNTPEVKVQPLWNWTRHFGRRSESASVGSEPGNVRILLISCDEEFRSRWQQSFDRRGWTLDYAVTLGQALKHLRVCDVPVIVYDSPAADDDWRIVLQTLQELPQEPCILLISSVIDESFRDEVVRLHGYEVFSRQADEEEITRTINSAWFWKHRHV